MPTKTATTTTRTRKAKPPVEAAEAIAAPSLIVLPDTLVVPSASLKTAVAALNRIVPSRPSHPILACIKLSLSNDGVTLSATDLSIGLRLTLSDARFEGEAVEVCISAKLLNDMLSHLDGEVSARLNRETSQVELSSGKRKYQLLYQPPDEFPESVFETVEAEPVELPAEAVQSIAKLIPFASDDATKQVLNAVRVELDAESNQLRLAATDGHKLGWCSLALEVKESIAINLSVPPISMLSALTNKQPVTVRLADHLAHFEGQGWSMTTRLLEGQFPNYQQLIPRQFSSTVTVSGPALEETVEACKVVADQKNGAVSCAFIADSSTLSASAPEVGDFEQTIESELDGNGICINFSSKYLLQSLKLVDTEIVQIQMNGPTSPAVLCGKGADRGDFQALIMPVRQRD